jgi:hypothetical protein
MKRRYSTAIGITVYLLILLLMPGQQAVAQSASEYEFTLEKVGYRDVTLFGHRSRTQYYYFGLPADWEVLDGSYIDLDFEFATPLLRPTENASIPTALLEVHLNDQLVHNENLFLSGTYQLRIELPTDLFYLPEDEYHNYIEIRFVGYEPCEPEVSSSVTIRNSSQFHLVYRERPLQIDLARLPKPIYQYQALEPNVVRFVLPDNFEETDLRAATIVASRLGQLTGNRVAISATLTSEQPAYASLGEHLIVVGSPYKNPMIEQLELPIPLVERQLALRSQMPMAVSPSSVLTYTLFVENTASYAQSLIVEDRFSPAAAFLGCGESCEQVASGKIRWDVGLLAAGQQASMTVMLQVTPVISFNTPMRHTATLFNRRGNILNVDTLSAQIGEKSDSRLVASPQQKPTRFFVQEAQAVAEDAGVLQETVSPWSARHVAVIVTGLNDEALLKAAHGLNPRNHFPGMSGESAIVEDTRPLSLPVSAPPQDITFASLGYENRELSVTDLEAEEYSFDCPPGSSLDKDSYLALHFAHAAIVSTVGGGVKVTLNGVPVGSVHLDDSNLSDAWLQIPLSKMAIQPGLNWIRIQSAVNILDPCLITRNNPYWLEIYADSFLHLDYRPTQTRFDLDSFPYPFNRPGDMANVLFALSNPPSLTEIEGLLRIASLLGSGSESKDFMPQVTFGGDFNLISLPDSHVIAIGLPTMNPAIRSANAQLPLPFLPDSNDIYQSIDGPIYGIPPGTDLGFVQELISPWDSEGNHAFVAATGTTEEGVRWAMSALAQSYHKLTGDLALVRGDEIYNTDTRPVVAEEVFSMTVSLTPTPDETPIGAAVETPTPQQVPEQTSTPFTSSQQDRSVKTPTLQQAPEQTGTRVTPTREYVQSANTTPPRPRWLFPLLIISVLAVVVSIVLSVRKAR